jgi:CBS domain-containing protein
MTIHQRKSSPLSREDQQLVDLVDSVLTDPNVHTDTRMRVHEEIGEILDGAHDDLQRAIGPAPRPRAPKSHTGRLPDLLTSVLVDPNLHTDTRMRLYSEIREILTAARSEMWKTRSPGSASAGLPAAALGLAFSGPTTRRPAMSETATQNVPVSYLMPSLEHATVADAMHPGVVSCPAEAGLTDVARLMTTHRVHCVAVMAISYDEQGDRYVWGLISDLDVLGAGIHHGPDASARALALEPVISVRPTLPLREAGEAMLTHGVSHLIVIDPNTQRPTGVLSSLDIAAVIGWGEG